MILKVDKDSMNRWGYIDNEQVRLHRKPEGMIGEGVKKGTYKKTEDATLQDLKKYQDFLYRNFLNTRTL